MRSVTGSDTLLLLQLPLVKRLTNNSRTSLVMIKAGVIVEMDNTLKNLCQLVFHMVTFLPRKLCTSHVLFERMRIISLKSVTLFNTMAASKNATTAETYGHPAMVLTATERTSKPC